MRRHITVSAGLILFVGGCNQVLGLDGFYNECGGPLDAPLECNLGGAGSTLSASSGSTSAATGGAGMGGGGTGAGNAQGGGGHATSTTSSGGSGGSAPVICQAGTTRDCYEAPDGSPGPANTEGVGLCAAGQETCSPDGTAWSACAGAVFPTPETCASTDDEDCNKLDCVAWGQGVLNAEIGSVAVEPTSGDVLIFAKAYAATQIGSTAFDPAMGNLFLARMHADGSGLSAIRIGDGASGTAGSMIFGPDGDLYLSGWFQSVPVGVTVPPTQFVMRLDPTGTQVRWNLSLHDTGTGAHSIPLEPPTPSIALTPSGDVAIAGTFYYSIDFGDGMHLPTSGGAAGNHSGYVAVVNGATGAASSAATGAQWAVLLSNIFEPASTSPVFYRPTVAADTLGNIYVAYTFSATTDITTVVGTNVGSYTSQGGTDGLVLGFRNGNLGFPLQIGDGANQTIARIAMGPDNAYVIAGTFGGSMTIPTSSGQQTTLTATAANGDAYALAVTTSGFMKWSSVFKATVQPFDLAVDSAGSTHLIGALTGPLDLGKGALDAGSGSDAFIALFDNVGATAWYRAYPHPQDLGMWARAAVSDKDTLVAVSANAWPLGLGTGDLNSAAVPTAIGFGRFAP